MMSYGKLHSITRSRHIHSCLNKIIFSTTVNARNLKALSQIGVKALNIGELSESLCAITIR
jgi:hypothetical protein